VQILKKTYKFKRVYIKELKFFFFYKMKISEFFYFLDEILVTPGSFDNEECDHPLSEDPNSKWNTFFKDNQALTQIDKDVR
jgi:hypothetical protein